MAAKKAAESPQEPATSAGPNTERPLEATGLGVDNPWDLAYGSNVPPRYENPPQPPAEQTHVGNMADPTPRHEYTVAGVTAKAEKTEG